MPTLQLAIRRLLHSPAFSLAVVLNFAMTAALFVAVLSIVDRVLLRPLPYGQADRLVMIRSGAHALSAFDYTAYASYPDANPGGATLRRAFTVAIKQSATSLEDVALATGGSAPRRIDGFGDQPVAFQYVTFNLLRTIGVRPIAGRDFTEADARTGYSRTVIISHELWTSRFARSLDVLERPGPAVTIVGVLPPGFILPSSRLSVRMDGIVVDFDRLAPRSPDLSTAIAPVARLKHGVAIETAAAEIRTIVQALRGASPADTDLTEEVQSGVVVEPLHTGMFRGLRHYATLALVAVGLVVVLGIANIATLVGIRWRARQTETAVRVALGAGPWAVVRATLTECLLLSFAGAVLAVVLCLVFRGAAAALVPDSLNVLAAAPIDFRVIAAAAAIGLVSALVAFAGVWVRFRRADTFSWLRDQNGDERRGPSRAIASHAALVVHLALSVGLIASALVAVRSFAELRWSRGFDFGDLISMSVQHGHELGAVEQRRQVLSLVRQARGVASATAVSSMPFHKTTNEDHVWKPRNQKGGVWGISAGFFETMRASLVAGRPLAMTELEGASAALLNERGARVLFPDRTPAQVVGMSLDTARGRRTIVGIARDVKPGGELAAEPGVFVSMSDPVLPDTKYRTPSARIVARTVPGQLLDLRALQVALDTRFGKGAILVATPVVQQILPGLAHLRLLAALLAALAIGALMVSATGIYAATAASLAFRRTEFAIRVALGATVRHLITLLLKAEVRAAVVGVAAGVGLSLWLRRMLEAYLTGVEVDGATTYAAVIVLLGSVAFAAICGPVVRVVKRTGSLLDAMRHP